MGACNIPSRTSQNSRKDGSTMKISCDVVTDLLPLYHEGVCNQSTKKLVAEHLEACESCRDLLGRISNTTIDNKIKAERQEVILHQAKALRMRYIQNIGAVIFAGLLFLGILTCVIVDLAISGTLSWSLIPISACVFAGLVFIPSIKYGTKGIKASLIIFSIFIVPFLFILSLLIDSDGLLLPIGIRMSIVLITYLWGTDAIFKRLRSRRLIATALSLALTIPFSLVVNLILLRMISTPLFDIWDVLSFAIIIVVAAILIFVDYYLKKR